MADHVLNNFAVDFSVSSMELYFIFTVAKDIAKAIYKIGCWNFYVLIICFVFANH